MHHLVSLRRLLFSVINRGLLDDRSIFFGFKNGNNISKRNLRARFASRVIGEHNTHVATNHTGTHFKGASGLFNVDLVRVATLNHVTVIELGSLSTSTTKLTGSDHFSTFGARLHDETKHTIGSTTTGKTTKKLVAKGLTLGLGVETTVGNALSVELY